MDKVGQNVSERRIRSVLATDPQTIDPMKTFPLLIVVFFSHGWLFSQQVTIYQEVANKDDLWKEDVYRGVEELVQLRRLSQEFFSVDSLPVGQYLDTSMMQKLYLLDQSYREEILVMKEHFLQKAYQEPFWNQGYRYLDAQIEFDKFYFYPQTYRIWLNPAYQTLGGSRGPVSRERNQQALAEWQEVWEQLSEENRATLAAWAAVWKEKSAGLGPRILEGTPTATQEAQQDLLCTLLLWSRFAAN